MSKDTIDIILVFVLLLTAAMVFIRIAVNGAADGFYNKDKKKAIEYTTEQKAGKKMKEQSSGKSINTK